MVRGVCIVLTSLFVLVAVPVRADWGEPYPAREVDRPWVIAPGMTEVRGEAAFARASRFYDESSRTRAIPEGGAQSAATTVLRGRYGLFRNLEVFFAAPWTVRLEAEGEKPVSGSGRAELGGRYEIQPMPATFVAGEAALVLPSTARRLRTDPSGEVHPDHLAVAGVVHSKQALLDSTAAHASFGFVYPFANADDRAADRDPPGTLFVTAGSTFQVSPRLWSDLAATFTRTNRDRVSGGVVPRSDQFRVDVRPSAGVQVMPMLDLGIEASVPVAGKNTPQSFSAGASVRLRF